jgi:ComF family protein
VSADRHDVIVAALLDLLLPPACPGCGQEGAVLCDACARPLRRRLDEPAAAPIGLPGSIPSGLSQLEWCAAFTGPVRAALHALKYDGARRLAPVLALPAAERWRRVGCGGDMVVPVPVHPDRLRQRGYDQAVLLAREVATDLGLPMREVLSRRTATAAQHSLGRGERARNVSSAFGVRTQAAALVENRWIVLVDDVMTTGATLAGCAAALLDAGALAVSGLTVARER